jgi:hypothetical protein
MQFVHHDLGSRSGGEIVEITLKGSAANVQLMDSSNFSAYKNRRNYRYQGGHYTRSPIHLQIPRSGHWHVAVDLGGHRGRVSSSARVLPGKLPAARERPMSSVPSLYQDVPPGVSEGSKEYDVFISHASEDKVEVVRPLASALQSGGLAVWYDEFELRIGDSLRRKIDQGLSKSRFGVVVLSPSFINKGWTNYELDGIVTRSMDGSQVMLPIWHELTKQQVIDYSPSLADKLARSTGMHTIQGIADEIIEVIGNRKTDF